ncbi:hypothetical protein GCM10009347_30450 [Shewanella algicola]|uniref:DUF3157 family protein n=1 Tax=Shewanella algicola TaxID=640633 RepID=A0A9X1ZAI5_9GAMM|nr:DUF3157 family protein [Shewanella algicola]MCL1106712.1 DUF3157 family protein [Shewanella algicola]GGP62215.1 hypothetical protein GCM10009347_30450 [Shewanella algicola]
MKTKLNAIASALFLLLAPAAMAADVAVITLENGANVRLKDDFTWEYIITETVAQPAIIQAPAVATEVVDASMPNLSATQQTSAVTTAVATTAANTTTRLTATAMAQPGLLGSTAKDGIKITLAGTQWKDNELGLIFDFDSSSDEHVTVVNVEASFFNDQGGLIKTETLEAWEAIFRMPETYLRKGQHRKSPVLWVEGINQQQWQQQLISLKIVEIESR